MNIKIYADGADLDAMIRLNNDSLIRGLTTNPTLCRKAGITNYEEFAKEVLKHVTEKPISFEVFSDDFPEMERQARKISDWGGNVFVKIPITNSQGDSCRPLIAQLAKAGIKVNVTAVMTSAQISDAIAAKPAIISIFNGRIMDTGCRPISLPWEDTDAEFLWASTREPYNIIQAEQMGYDIITVPDAILAKYRQMQNMDLGELSLETVRMFKRDAEGYTL